jgi:FMN phosphatase YigB (HAD superfamily)
MSRAVIFDFGAVLFRWQPAALLQQVVPELAPDDAAARALAASIFQSFTPHSDWARFDLGLIDAGALAQSVAGRIGLKVQTVAWVIEAAGHHLVALPTSVELMRALKAEGHRLFYLSNMPLPYAERLQRDNPFIGDFDDGIFSSRVGLMKPWPAIFELAQRRFQLEAGPQTIFLDDHAGNVAAGAKQGWQGLHFVDAAQAERELRQRGWLSPPG